MKMNSEKEAEKERQEEEQEPHLRWAVRSSSVMQAPRGDLSSGMLAVSSVLVLKRTCLTGCLWDRR